MAFLWVIEMSKHTPGPWFISGRMTKFIEARIPGGMIQEVAGVGPTDFDNGYGEQQEANARLISAAPDLLAAAERVLEKLDHPTLGVTIYDADALRDAIAKARGEA